MLYNSTGNLPIYNFDKIIRNNDYRYLVMGWNERDDIKLPEDVEDIWTKIYNEYCKKTENNESLTYYALANEASYLETRLIMVVTLVEGLTDTNKEEYGKELNAWRIRFNPKGKIKDQIPQLKRQLKAVNQKYEIKLAELNRLKTDEEPVSILKQKIRLERITGLKIDLRTTVVDEWIEINNEAIEITEAQKKNG